MSRKSWIYPADGGEPYERGTRPQTQPSQGRSGPTILPDQPDFVSPIDGRTYSGRAGMREHNVRHNVVSNRDLQGLPTLTNQSDLRSPESRRQDAAARKELIIRQVMGH